MSNFNVFIFLSIGTIGFGFGIYCILLVVLRKDGIEIINKGKLGFPFNLGSPLLNRINFIWIGIVLMIFFGGLIFAIVQEKYFK